IFEVAYDVAIIDLNPKLVKPINTGSPRIQPDRTSLGLAALAAVGFCYQRQRETINRSAMFLPYQINTYAVVAPLVAAANFHLAIVIPALHIKIKSLQQHITELGIANA